MSNSLIFNLMKPRGMTSMQAVARLRRILNVKKAGHTGTLDPNVSGVLPVFTGMATKLIHLFEEGSKEYEAEITFGITTDTQDADGSILSQNEVPYTKEELISTINSFVGEITQIPPMYSAIKVNGEKLCNLARKGIEIERKVRKATIYSIDILDYVAGAHPKVRFKVSCSRGTYIRTLCVDIGQRLGCGAYMSDLIRTRSGSFKIDSAVTFEEIEANINNLKAVSIEMEKVCNEYKRVDFDDFIFNKFMNGTNIYYKKLGIKLSSDDKLVRIYNNDKFVALAELVQNDDNYLKIHKQFLN